MDLGRVCSRGFTNRETERKTELSIGEFPGEEIAAKQPWDGRAVTIHTAHCSLNLAIF